jgi:hypothetical protein
MVEMQDEGGSAVPVRRSRRTRRIFSCIVMLAVLAAFAAGGMLALFYFTSCNHCYAFASTPTVGRAVLEFYSVHKRLPSDYRELGRAANAGQIKTAVPGALYKGEWTLLSIKAPPRYAAIYSRTDGQGVSEKQILSVLHDPSTTSTERPHGVMFAGYELLTSASVAREIFFWDGGMWSEHYHEPVISLSSPSP